MLKRLQGLENRLKSRFEQIEINGRNCFILGNDEIIHLTGLTSFNAIVIEYAESKDDADKNMFEDGDLFYLDELDEDAMFEAMIREIEDN